MPTDDFEFGKKYEELPKLPEAGAFRTQNGQTILTQGGFQSPNFKKGSVGWEIDAIGNAEFNDGTFRGTFTIGGKLITVSDITKLQTAINDVSDAGGGTVALVPATYNATTSFTIPSNVTLDGNGATIDFGNGARQILIQGTNAYAVGTLAVNNDSTAVTGTGTTWTAGMVGRYILIKEFWYLIAAVPSMTSITLDSPELRNMKLAESSPSSPIKPLYP